MPTGRAISSASDLRRADHRQRHRHAAEISLSTSIRLMNEKPQSPCSIATQPVDVAQPDRVVEAEVGAQVPAHLGRHVRVQGHLRERVAGRERQHREQHDADAEQARQGDQQAPEEVVAHDAPGWRLTPFAVPVGQAVQRGPSRDTGATRLRARPWIVGR